MQPNRCTDCKHSIVRKINMQKVDGETLDDLLDCINCQSSIINGGFYERIPYLMLHEKVQDVPVQVWKAYEVYQKKACIPETPDIEYSVLKGGL